MSDSFEFHSRRSPVYSRDGMVAASQPLAVAAGLEALRLGGTAADAAVAAAAALNVSEPASTGLGGDAFALFYQAAARRIHALNGSGRAPQTLTLQRLQKEGLGDHLPATHAYTVTVPGACAAWCDLVERFGRLSLAQVLAPAIRLAEEGCPISPITSYYWRNSAQGLLASSVNGQELTIDGRGPNPGECFRNPALANTLRVIAESGKAAFYQGRIAAEIVRAVQTAGGCLAEDDLAAHLSAWDEPISTTYHNIRVWECPPNGQGIAALLALNILEGWDLSGLPALGAERLHVMIEAMRLAFMDARRYVADPAFSAIPLQELLSKEYAARRRRLIDPRHANPELRAGTPLAGSDTVYLSVVDREGNACSFINSNYMNFGTGIVPHNCGFGLQNRGHNFSLQAGHPNALAPGKRPYHTIIPAMATHAESDELFACLGVMGGFMQPQGHFQVLLGLAQDGLDPQSALDRPRFCIRPDEISSRVSLESDFPADVIAKLEEMGHAVTVVRGMERSLFGRGQIILRDRENQVLCAGSDPRADGCAMGLIGV